MLTIVVYEVGDSNLRRSIPVSSSFTAGYWDTADDGQYFQIWLWLSKYNRHAGLGNVKQGRLAIPWFHAKEISALPHKTFTLQSLWVYRKGLLLP